MKLLSFFRIMMGAGILLMLGNELWQHGIHVPNEAFSISSIFTFLSPLLWALTLDAIYIFWRDRSFKQSSFASLFQVRVSNETDLLIWFLIFNSAIQSFLFASPNAKIHEGVVFVQSYMPSLNLSGELFWHGLLAFLVYSFADFLFHWLCHRVPFLWELHKIHHSATELTPLTTYREHPLINFLKNAFVPLVMGLIGFSAGPIAFVFFMRSILLFVYHSQVNSRLGFFGKLWISPHAHRLHHLRSPHREACNFGFDITLWDRLFKTFRYEIAAGEKMQFGLEGNDAPLNDRYLIWTLFSTAWESLQKMIPFKVSRPKALAKNCETDQPAARAS